MNFYVILINTSKLKRFLLFSIVIILSIFPKESFSQQDTSIIDIQFLPAVALNNIVQYSNAKIMSNYIHPGIVSGIKGEDTIFIKNVMPLDTSIVDTKDYEKILFHWDYFEKKSNVHRSQYWYFDVSPKKEFDVTFSPIREVVDNEIVLSNKELKRIIEDGLIYEIKIDDEVNQDQILLTIIDDAQPYIEIIKIDSGKTYARYHIKLKDKNEFAKNLSKDQKDKWSKGKEVKIPIGINLVDKNIPAYKREFDLVLVKEKQPKQKDN